MEIKNFLFHRVHPQRDPMWDPMDPSRFDALLSYFSKKYTVLPIEEIVAERLWEKIDSKKKKLASVQFDDGYRDNLEYAAPLLEKHKIRASFYIVTQCIETGIATWTYNLDYLILHTQKQSLQLDMSFVPEHVNSISLSSADKRPAQARRLKAFLKTCNGNQRTLLLNSIFQQLNDVEIPNTLMMNWSQVAQLKAAGHFIGSHTHTHAMLGTLTSESQVMDELVLSKNLIEYNLNTPVVSLAYPVGSFTDATIRLTKMAGYQMAMAVEQQNYDPYTHGIFSIPRIELYNEPFVKSFLRINNQIQSIKTLFGKV